VCSSDLENFKAEAEKYMADFLKHSRPVAMWTRRAIKASLNINFLEALRMSEIMYLDGCMKTKDAIEGISAFMDKRKAVWKDE
jgi:cyclohexa-1,5-dienecarbonyl-CoA hydratase